MLFRLEHADLDIGCGLELLGVEFGISLVELGANGFCFARQSLAFLVELCDVLFGRGYDSSVLRLLGPVVISRGVWHRLDAAWRSVGFVEATGVVRILENLFCGRLRAFHRFTGSEGPESCAFVQRGDHLWAELDCTSLIML